MDELDVLVKISYRQGVNDAIEKCAEIISSLVGICKISCPIDCQWGTEESCIESWKVYLKDKIEKDC